LVLTVDGKTTTTTRLNIAGAACHNSLAPTSESFAAAGGTGSVNVTAGAGCFWTASSNIPWITIISGGSTSSGAVNYSVAANTSTSARTATLRIAGQSFTITQAGAADANAP